MSDPVRQHHNLATGKSLTAEPPKTKNPGFKKGGKVAGSMKGTAKKSGGKRGC